MNQMITHCNQVLGQVYLWDACEPESNTADARDENRVHEYVLIGTNSYVYTRMHSHTCMQQAF